PPVASGVQRPRPVGELEGGVRGGRPAGRIRLLRGNYGGPELVAVHTVRRGNRNGEGRHEVGRLEDEFGVALELALRGFRAVADLRKVDQMRLLPDQERSDRTRRLAALGPDLLGPARAGEPLAACGRAGDGQYRLVPREAALQELRPAPSGEVKSVKPVHLEVELAAPGGEPHARFGRRARPRGVDCLPVP